MQDSQAPAAHLLMRVLNPVVVFSSFVGLTFSSQTRFDSNCLLFAIVASFLTAQVFRDTGLHRCWPRTSLTPHVRDVLVGWAQVHGLRGETETVDKMQKRVDYDREYIRRWSLSLDLLIILRTAAMVFKRNNAY